MRKLTVLASVLAAGLASSTVAQAACTQAHMNNKYWKLTAYDKVLKVLTYCKFRTSAAGTIDGNATGCQQNTIGVDADFSAPDLLTIINGEIKMRPNDNCTYDLTLTLGATGDSLLRGQVVLESGKSIANGGYLMSISAGGLVIKTGGTISLMKQ